MTISELSGASCVPIKPLSPLGAGTLQGLAPSKQPARQNPSVPSCPSPPGTAAPEAFYRHIQWSGRHVLKLSHCPGGPGLPTPACPQTTAQIQRSHPPPAASNPITSTTPCQPWPWGFSTGPPRGCPGSTLVCPSPRVSGPGIPRPWGSLLLSPHTRGINSARDGLYVRQ